MARRVPRRPPEVAAVEHMRESFAGATRGRSSVPLPVSRDSKLLARMRNGSANPLNVVRAYQDEFVLSGGEETVELTYLPLTYSEHVYLNGVYQREGADYDWTRQSGTRTVTVKAAMDARDDDVLIVEYLYYVGAPVIPGDSTPVAAAYVGSGTTPFDLTSISPGLPVGTSDGDLLVLHLVSKSEPAGSVFSGVSGWTLQGTATSENIDNTGYACIAVYTRVYSSATYSTPTITATNVKSGAAIAGQITAWSNASLSGVVETWESTAASPWSVPGITTTVDDSYVLHLVAVANDNSITGWSAANLSYTSTGSEDNLNVGLGVAYGVMETAGATGILGHSSLAVASAAVTLEIR